jgi:hypothetical protein
MAEQPVYQSLAEIDAVAVERLEWPPTKKQQMLDSRRFGVSSVFSGRDL